MEAWLATLMDGQTNISNDYGNLVLSTGLAAEQRPHIRQGLDSAQELNVQPANASQSQIRQAMDSAQKYNVQLANASNGSAWNKGRETDMNAASMTSANAVQASLHVLLAT